MFPKLDKRIKSPKGSFMQLPQALLHIYINKNTTGEQLMAELAAAGISWPQKYEPLIRPCHPHSFEFSAGFLVSPYFPGWCTDLG